MAYFSGYSQMVNLDQLYETLSVLEDSMGGMAFIIEQMLNRAMLHLDVEQQEFLFFIAHTLKESKSKIRNICPDGSGPRFELVKLTKE